MALTDPFVLPAGTVLVPVSELPENVRREIQAEEDDVAISRPNSRAQSKILDREAAALVRHFEKPHTIAQAVARYSRGKEQNPEQLLEEAFPLLQSLIASQLLVAADSQEAQEIQATLKPGEVVEGWTILRCVQTLEDTELYQMRGAGGELGALKIARADAGHRIDSMLEREAQVLSRLDGKITPRLLNRGEWNGRRFLLIEWCAGADVSAIADEFRRRASQESRAELLRLATTIVDAYAWLHEQGVMHGDVHPRNVFVDRQQAVKIIDFGLACFAGEEQRRGNRGGVGFFLEPELARAAMSGSYPPPLTMLGEQYAVAVMLYLLFTGGHHLDFSLEKEKMLRQIAEDPVLPFTRRNAQPWPEVEAVLAKALSKNPADRFSSMREFWRALNDVKAPTFGAQAGQPDPGLLETKKTSLEKVGLSGPLLTGPAVSAPSTSVNYGAAGIAYALYRMACAGEDAELLALADAWASRAVRQIRDEGAFYDKEIDITKETVGETSLYHSPAGVYAVQALIAQASGNPALQQLATSAFLEASSKDTDKLDVTLGRAGTILGSAFLLSAAEGSLSPEMQPLERLRSFGRERAARLWETMESFGPIRESKELSNLGAAHGWAGLLYSILCWSAVSHDPLPSGIGERLQQLGECAEPVGRGLRWPWDLTRNANQQGGYMPGWCNGTAGYVFLWTLAHKMLGDPDYLAWAEGAAWNVWETAGPIGNLCCGMAGQAYALLNFYRHTEENVWLSRARDAARYAVVAQKESIGQPGYEQFALRTESLYKGELGIAVLAADLERPEQACMPLFELES
jgi:serine/threonine-protein kinase